jgi:Effector protein
VAVATREEIKAELKKIGKRDPDIIALFYPTPEPITGFPNARIGITNFEEWFNGQPAPQQVDMRAAVQRYKLAQDDYRNQTRDQVKAILKTDTGKAVFADIGAAKPLKLTIRAYVAEEDGDDNAYSRGVSQTRSTLKGEPVRDSDGTPIPAYGLGTGEGSLAEVAFTPGMWGPKGTSNMTGPGSLPDEVLLHELIHAARQMKGIIDSRAVDSGYENEEELVAIVVCNVYLSEKKQTVFRASHMIQKRKIARYTVGLKFDVLPDPDKFLDNPLNVAPPPDTVLAKVRTREPDLWKAMKAVKAPFNPFRDLDAKKP